MQAAKEMLHIVNEAAGYPLQQNLQRSGANLGGQAIQATGCTVTSNKDPDAKHLALTWHGKKDVRVESRPRPMITDPEDVVIKVTATAICGSDLHLYLGNMVGLQSGDILGHEFMGIIDEVGPEVKTHMKGDKVVVCFDIGCGKCYFCNHGMYSACDTTNGSAAEEYVYGDNTGGFFGYSHLTGGWEGGQAEYVRVPFADTNCLPVPPDVSDLKVLFLSDILPTAWHANELGEVGPGDNVAIWGAGPVGILAAHCAQHRGAAEVILIDREEYRLDFAKNKLPGIKTINFSKEKVKATLKQMLPLGAPDVCLECVGMHYTKTMLHKVEMAVGLETDTGDVLNEMFYSCRKYGRIGVVGAYAAYINHVNFGAFMEKGLSMRAGQTPCQKYWPVLLPKVLEGSLNPSMVITHVLPLEEAPKGYKVFNDKSDNCIKVVLKPPSSQGLEVSA